MTYIKHYYINDETDKYVCDLNDTGPKRHPWKEYLGLDVKMWFTDADGVDIMLSEIPDSTAVSTVISDCGKNAVEVITKSQYESVATPYFESESLRAEAAGLRAWVEDLNLLTYNENIAFQKESEASVKYQEALQAFRSL